jgi:hypothetical protein
VVSDTIQVLMNLSSAIKLSDYEKEYDEEYMYGDDQAN